MKTDYERFTNIDRTHILSCLRMVVGGDGVPVKQVSFDTGISTDTIRSHMDSNGCTRPDGPMLLAYMSVLGDAFCNAILAPIGRTSKKAVIVQDLCLHQTTVTVSGAMTLLLTATADNVVDHMEERILPDPLIAAGNEFINAGISIRERTALQMAGRVAA